MKKFIMNWVPFGMTAGILLTIGLMSSNGIVVSLGVLTACFAAMIKIVNVSSSAFIEHLCRRQQQVILEMRGVNEETAGQRNIDPRKAWEAAMKQREKGEEEIFSLVNPAQLGVRLNDVKGLSETRKDVIDIIKAFKNANAIADIGGEAPKGLLLMGPPGTGKTMLAKAIAAEANCNFIAVSGAQFNEKYVGVGQMRVRALFKMARKNAPCIIFIDEIDALCPKRGDESSSERDSTINQLLTEMDGFANNEGVFVIGATNRDELLDPAVTRPGRLDRVINVPLPDRCGRREVLATYLNKIRCYPLDVEALVAKTSGFSPAELKNLINTAAIIAVSDGRKIVSPEDINEGYYKILMKGNKRETATRSTEQDKLIAYHEAGHALVHSMILGNDVPEVNIIESTSGAGGVTIHTNDEDVLPSKANIRNRIVAMYAGRAAEEILLGSKDSITTGASQDITQASQLLRSYLERWGMKDDVLLDYSVFKKNGDALEDAKTLAQELYQEALNFLKENSDVLDAVANKLIADRSIDNDMLTAVISETIAARSSMATSI